MNQTKFKIQFHECKFLKFKAIGAVVAATASAHAGGSRDYGPGSGYFFCPNRYCRPGSGCGSCNIIDNITSTLSHTI